jgi:hypothetical protein
MPKENRRGGSLFNDSIGQSGLMDMDLEVRREVDKAFLASPGQGVVALPKDSPTPMMRVKEVPSGFKPYPRGAEIYYRPWRVAEIQQFNQAEELWTRDKYLMALEALEVTGFEKEDLSIFDLFYVSLIRKISAIGSQRVLLSRVCPNCGKQVSLQVETKDLEFADFEPEVFPVVPRFSGFSDMKFGVLTVRGMLDLIGKGLTGQSLIPYLSRCVIGEDWDGAYARLGDLSSYEDYEILGELNRMLFHGLKPFTVQCPHTVDEVLPPDGSNKISYQGILNLWQKREIEKLNELAEGMEPGLSQPFQQIMTQESLARNFSDLGAHLGLLYRQRCETLVALRPEAGDITISPFREPGRSVKDKIFFGDAFAHKS